MSVPRLRGLRKKSQRKTDGRSDDRTDGRLRRRRRKRPRHRRHESPTEKKTSKGCVIQNADQRSRTIIDRVVVGGGDPLMIRVRLSLAPRARTMFSVEPIDQSARTTTLRFACVVVVKEEKHRQSFHSSFITPSGWWWRCVRRRRISRVSTDREILPLTYRTNATRLVETGNGGVGRLGGNLLSDHRRDFERVCVVAVVRRASRRVVSDARFEHGFLNSPQKWGRGSLTNYESSCQTQEHDFLND